MSQLLKPKLLGEIRHKVNAPHEVWGDVCCCLGVRGEFHGGCGLQNGLLEMTEVAYIMRCSRKLAGADLCFPCLLP